jgi:hypothetical protein
VADRNLPDGKEISLFHLTKEIFLKNGMQINTVYLLQYYTGGAGGDIPFSPEMDVFLLLSVSDPKQSHL